MPQGYDILIGTDTFFKFGFGINGLPGLGNSIDKIVPHPVEDPKSALAPLVPAAVEQTPHYQELKKSFMVFIQPYLAKNAAIPKDTFCTLPESVVHLRTPPNVTAWKRQYSIGKHLHQHVDKAIDEWLTTGTIFRLRKRSSFNIPLILVGKKDLAGKKTDFRPCLDPRELNVLLENDQFELPLIRDIFQDLAGSKVFTTIDLTKAYHRFQIAEEDRHKTAFTWRNQQYAFRGAPFGIKTLPSIFQRAMSILLGDLAFVRVFIDDIIIFSKSYEDHFEHVAEVLHRLNEAKLLINESKCHFFRTELKLLGFVVSTEGIRADPDKLDGIDSWPEPTTAKELQHYLGLFNYFREHIPLYARAAAPLERIRNELNMIEVWDEIHQKAFDTLKALLSSARILSFPDFTQLFLVATDASNNGIGAVLYQIIDGKIHWISFAARALQGGEKNYSATQKELLAVVFALIRFQQYLWGGPKFTLFTDHKALTHMRNKPQLSPMILKWLDTLWDFEFDIVHRPGVANILPDHLSRLFPAEPKEPTRVPRQRTSSEPNASGENCTEPLKYMRVSYMNLDPKDKKLRVVPEEKRAAMLEETHTKGHFGAVAMVNAIHEDNWTWPNLRDDCLAVVRKCVPCQRFNISKRGHHPLRPIHAQMPVDHMTIDLAGPFVKATTTKNRYLLVAVDVCIRFVFLKAIPDKTAERVTNELFTLFCDWISVYHSIRQWYRVQERPYEGNDYRERH